MKDWVIPMGLFVANVGINLLLSSAFNDALQDIENKMNEKSPQNISSQITTLNEQNLNIQRKLDGILQILNQKPQSH